MSSELKASSVVWPRLRKALVATTFLVGGGAGAFYALAGGRILLDADGIITQDRVVVSTPFDARVTEILVRPGDYVQKGQKMAVVDSANVTRTRADLTIEKARMQARIAQLEARQVIVKQLLPLAEASAQQSRRYLDTLRGASQRGLAVDRTVNELTLAATTAAEKSLTLKAEAISTETELKGTLAALEELSATLASLSKSYSDGVLTAPKSGYVGTTVATVGEILSGNGAKVTSIYSGTKYALAYIPESYLFDLEEGQRVAVRARGQTISATLDSILPVTDALPPEFQAPNRVRERGQLVRVMLEGDATPLALDQKVRVTSCLRSDCNDSIKEALKTAGESARSVAVKVSPYLNDLVTRVSQLTSDALKQLVALGSSSANASVADEKTDDAAGIDF